MNMIKHTIPTLLETQDKILFGLTAKQVLVIFAGFGATGIIWGNLEVDGNGLLFWFLLAFSLLPAVVALAIAFIRIASESLDEWFMIAYLFALLPKDYVWSFFSDEQEDFPMINNVIPHKEEEEE